jgi:RNA polymerase-binding transcription factor DksA
LIGAGPKIFQHFYGVFDFLCYSPAPLMDRELLCKPGTIFRTMMETSKTMKKTTHTTPQTPATAAAILGRPMARKSAAPGPKKIKPEWQKYYQRLLELREQLLHQMNGLAQESAQEVPGYSLHMADSGTDNFDRDFALSLLSSDQDAVYEIEEALKRIEKKTYGVCELTGKPIPRARLDAIPWTRFRVEAQAQLEREGALRQRRLGALGTIDSAAVAEVEGEEEESEEKAKEKE